MEIQVSKPAYDKIIEEAKKGIQNLLSEYMQKK
jgi:hypothetical protein